MIHRTAKKKKSLGGGIYFEHTLIWHPGVIASFKFPASKKKKNPSSLLFCEREPEINPAVFASALPTITPRGSTGGQERCSAFHLKRSHFVGTEDTKSFTAPHFFPAGPTFHSESTKRVKLQERFVLTLSNVLSLLVSRKKSKNVKKIHV